MTAHTQRVQVEGQAPCAQGHSWSQRGITRPKRSWGSGAEGDQRKGFQARKVGKGPGFSGDQPHKDKLRDMLLKGRTCWPPPGPARDWLRGAGARVSCGSSTRTHTQQAGNAERLGRG